MAKQARLHNTSSHCTLPVSVMSADTHSTFLLHVHTAESRRHGSVQECVCMTRCACKVGNHYAQEGYGYLQCADHVQNFSGKNNNNKYFCTVAIVFCAEMHFPIVMISKFLRENKCTCAVQSPSICIAIRSLVFKSAISDSSNFQTSLSSMLLSRGLDDQIEYKSPKLTKFVNDKTNSNSGVQ